MLLGKKKERKMLKGVRQNSTEWKMLRFFDKIWSKDKNGEGHEINAKIFAESDIFCHISAKRFAAQENISESLGSKKWAHSFCK